MRLISSCALLMTCISMAVPAWPRGDTEKALLDLGFEQLMDLEVSTAARKEQPLSQTPAAAYVITSDDIRRSGAASIPEALRLAPGVAVAQISPSKWSVSIRGFSGRFANKLLVLIDGRSIYTPAFSGVYWEIHDLPLEDIERIEVIRGPGATLWGANAVNGIINIITRHASATHGAALDLRGGSNLQSGSLRWGGRLGEQADLRLYAKAQRQDGFEATGGSELENGYQRQQAGFRADWAVGGSDQFTLQGDLIRLDQDQEQNIPDLANPPAFSSRIQDRVDVNAGNLLARWERSLAVDSEVRLQAYYDYYEREEFSRSERVATLDLDLQHHFSAAGRHDIIWGLAYRHTDDTTRGNPALVTERRDSRSLDTFSGFIQDEIELVDDSLWLTLGSKVEHNDLTGVEWQPNVRALWTPDADQSLWGSISRAVRTPSFGERDYSIARNSIPPFSAQNPGPLPIIQTLDGDPGYGSERLVAYELGYRRRFDPRLTLDAALYYNDYDHLLVTRFVAPQFQGDHLSLPTLFHNDMAGSTYGAELTLDWHPAAQWRIQPSLALWQADLHLKADNNLPAAAAQGAIRFREQSDPQLQFSLRAGWSPRSDLDLDLWLRHVSEVPTLGGSTDPGVAGADAYTTLDLRAAWRPLAGLELALIGKNLLQDQHREGVEELYAVPSEVPRSIMATLRYGF